MHRLLMVIHYKAMTYVTVSPASFSIVYNKNIILIIAHLSISLFQVRFFEESVFEKLNRSSFTFTQKSTPFLSSTADDIRETYAPPQPNVSGLRVGEVFEYVLILIILSYALAISLCRGVMVIISPIEWYIGEPMPVFFYRILQYTISLA